MNEPKVMESAIVTWGEPTKFDKIVIGIIVISGTIAAIAMFVVALWVAI